jgi:hypothetical protein
MSSYLEKAWDVIVTEYQGITLSNGYRNDLEESQVLKTIRPPDLIQHFPEVGVQIVEERAEPLDDARTVWDDLATVHVVGVVQSELDLTNQATKMIEALESLAHDLKRKTAGMMKTYVVNTSYPWNIDKGGFTLYRHSLLWMKRPIAAVEIKFDIRVRRQTSTF